MEEGAWRRGEERRAGAQTPKMAGWAQGVEVMHGQGELELAGEGDLGLGDDHGIRVVRRMRHSQDHG